MPDNSLCRAAASPIASASAVTPCTIALQLLLPICIRFNCCSPLESASAAALNCVHFNCFPIASISAAAPRLHLLQLLLLDCIHFGCCSLFASNSATARRLCLLQLLLPDCVCFGCCSLPDSSPCPMFLNILRRVRGSVN